MVVSSASEPLFLRHQTYPTARRNYQGKNSSEEVKRRERKKDRKTKKPQRHEDMEEYKGLKREWRKKTRERKGWGGGG